MTVSAETRFGRLIVKREIEPHVNSSGRRIRKFECFCDCGNICTIIGWELTRGNTKSCGCLHKEKMKKKFTTHGMSRSNIYAIWSLMVDRCNNRHTPGYKNYGGRGIKICKSWLKFENFFEDMGERPKGMSIERINNNGDYRSSNCKWATRKEQNRNSRNNHLVTHKGETKCIAEWAENLKINYKTLWSRLQRHPNKILSALEGGTL